MLHAHHGNIHTNNITMKRKKSKQKYLNFMVLLNALQVDEEFLASQFEPHASKGVFSVHGIQTYTWNLGQSIGGINSLMLFPKKMERCRDKCLGLQCQYFTTYVS